MMLMTGMAINAQVPDIDSAAIIINESGNFDPKATLRAEDRRRNSGELKWMELTVKQRIRGRFFDPTVSIATHRGEDGKSINHSWTCTIWNELIL